MSDVINEPVGSSGSTSYSGTLRFKPVIANSVRFTDGVRVVTDNGSGVLQGNVNPGGTNTIDYTTGDYDFTFNATSTADVTVDYEIDDYAVRFDREHRLKETQVPEFEVPDYLTVQQDGTPPSPIILRTNKITVAGGYATVTLGAANEAIIDIPAPPDIITVATQDAVTSPTVVVNPTQVLVFSAPLVVTAGSGNTAIISYTPSELTVTDSVNVVVVPTTKINFPEGYVTAVGGGEVNISFPDMSIVPLLVTPNVNLSTVISGADWNKQRLTLGKFCVVPSDSFDVVMNTGNQELQLDLSTNFNPLVPTSGGVEAGKSLAGLRATYSPDDFWLYIYLVHNPTSGDYGLWASDTLPSNNPAFPSVSGFTVHRCISAVRITQVSVVAMTQTDGEIRFYDRIATICRYLSGGALIYDEVKVSTISGAYVDCSCVMPSDIGSAASLMLTVSQRTGIQGPSSYFFFASLVQLATDTADLGGHAVPPPPTSSSRRLLTIGRLGQPDTLHPTFYGSDSVPFCMELNSDKTFYLSWYIENVTIYTSLVGTGCLINLKAHYLGV